MTKYLLPLIAGTLLLSNAACKRQAERELADLKPAREVPESHQAAPEPAVAPEMEPSTGGEELVAVPATVASASEPELPSAEATAAGDAMALTAENRAPSGPEDFKGYEAWFERYGLDLNDSKMLDADPDGDGYSNRDEFLVDTDPTDPVSHPGFHPVMRLRSFKAVETPLVLESVDGRTAKISDRTSGATNSVRAGDTIPGTTLKVKSVIEQVESDKFGQMTDQSRVLAEDTATGERVSFVIGMSPRSAASFATLTSAHDPTITVSVRQGEEFEWPGGEGRKFLVVDLRSEQVVVKQLDSGEVWTIPAERSKP